MTTTSTPQPGHEIPTLSLDELRQTQLERLRQTVRTAYDNVPHYRASFDAAGIHPDDVTSLDDLPRLPFTTKADAALSTGTMLCIGTIRTGGIWSSFTNTSMETMAPE